MTYSFPSPGGRFASEFFEGMASASAGYGVQRVGLKRVVRKRLVGVLCFLRIKLGHDDLLKNPCARIVADHSSMPFAPRPLQPNALPGRR